MKKSGLLIISLLTVVSLIITSCSTKAPIEPPILQSTETTVVEIEVKATLTPTATPTPEPILCRVIFDSDRDGNREIYKTNPDGSGTVNLTNNPGDDHAPAYSPDGDQIAFVSDRDNGEETGKFIYVMNSDGSHVRQLTHEENCEDPDWSNDGTMITYSNNGNIYTIKADGSENSTCISSDKDSPMEDSHPKWSPDGLKIAWLVNNPAGRNAFVMNSDGSNVTQVGFNNESYDVSWVPDGRLFTGWIWESQDRTCNNCISTIDGTEITDAGGKGEVANYLPFWTAGNERAEIAQTDLFTGNDDILVIGSSLPDSLGLGFGAINISNNPASDRNLDYPINCGKGWFIDTEAIEAAKKAAEPVIVVLGFAGDDPSQWQRKNNYQKACNELSIECQFHEIPELINNHVSAIILNSSPEKIEKSAAEIKSAVDNGIPVFVLNAEIDMEGVYTIMADQGDMMRATLNELFKGTGGAGELAYFDFSPTQYEAGILQHLLEKEYPKIQVVITDTEKFNFKDDKMYLNELLDAYPDLQAIWTNDGYDNAIFGIVEHYSDPAKYPKLKCGAYKDNFYIWKDRLVDYPEFECVSVSNPPGIAYDAVYAAHLLVSGEKIDPSALGGEFGNAFIVDFTVITNDNLLQELEKIQYEDGRHVPDLLLTPDEIKDKWFE